MFFFSFQLFLKLFLCDKLPPNFQKKVFGLFSEKKLQYFIQKKILVFFEKMFFNIFLRKSQKSFSIFFKKWSRLFLGIKFWFWIKNNFGVFPGKIFDILFGKKFPIFPEKVSDFFGKSFSIFYRKKCSQLFREKKFRLQIKTIPEFFLERKFPIFFQEKCSDILFEIKVPDILRKKFLIF